MGIIAIFGAAGAIGRAVANELENRGMPFRAVGRNGQKLNEAFGRLRYAEIFPADLGDLRSAAAAARDADSIIYAVGAPYPAFHLHPKLMRTTVEAATSMNVRKLTVVTSVYSYGVPQTPRVAETHPREPHAEKGKRRKEQEDIALDAWRRDQLETSVVRLPDFYGPYADNSLANPILRAALAGKTANWLGPADKPHEFIYVPDAAPLILDLTVLPDCAGEWNIGGPGEITGKEFITLAYRAAGRAPKFRTAGKTLLRVAGWFSPVMRELVEMQYLAETPVILDDAKLSARLGPLRKTPYEEGIRQTLEWMRSTGV